MNKKEALELLANSWFVSMDGKHGPQDAMHAIELAKRCLVEAEPYRKKASQAKKEAKALMLENKTIRVELEAQSSALRALLGNISIMDFADANNVLIAINIPKDEYDRFVIGLVSYTM